MFTMFKMFFATITNGISIINRAMQTVDNYARVAEQESETYLKSNGLQSAADLKALEADLAD